MSKRFLESSCNYQESKLIKREFEPVLIQNYLDGNGMLKWKDFESMVFVSLLPELTTIGSSTGASWSKKI
jgi:hypothetical protein